MAEILQRLYAFDVSARMGRPSMNEKNLNGRSTGIGRGQFIDLKRFETVFARFGHNNQCSLYERRSRTVVRLRLLILL